MPQSNRRGISIRTAILLATAACLVGCVPVAESLSDTAAAPMAPEALPAPVALAPELTGPQPATQPAAASAAKIAAVLTIPALLPAPDPGPTASPAATAPAPPPVACPPDTVGKWSGPDITGAPVFICRRLTAR